VAVRLGQVDARLAADGDAVAGRDDQPALALAEQTRGIRERRDLAAELRLELSLGLDDLAFRRLVVDREQIRVGDRVRLEPQRPARVEVADLLPRQHRRLPAHVPGK